MCACARDKNVVGKKKSLPGRRSNRGPPVWKSEALTAWPRQLRNQYVWIVFGILDFFFSLNNRNVIGEKVVKMRLL